MRQYTTVQVLSETRLKCTVVYHVGFAKLKFATQLSLTRLPAGSTSVVDLEDAQLCFPPC
jgi:hypothetical protein